MRFIHASVFLRRAAVAGLLLLSAGVLGCPKHENFPTQLDLVVPPTPTSFVITDEGPNPAGGYDYDLSWTVSDATDVDRYRVYLLEIGPPQLVAETPNTVLPVTLPFKSTGLRLAVAAVSTGNVEGESRTAVAP